MAKFIEPEMADISREQYILKQILQAAVFSVDSIFAEDGWTLEQMKETIKDMKNGPTQSQVENLHSLTYRWLEMYKDREIEGWYDHGK